MENKEIGMIMHLIAFLKQYKKELECIEQIGMF